MTTLFMETTQVPDTTTVAQIQHLLSRNGATSVMVEYENGNVNGLAFRLQVGDQQVPFKLPCRWPAVEKLIHKTGKKPRKNDTVQRWARRVAWRQILRWVEAQLALIQTGMVKSEEVFMPYAIVHTNGEQQTMYEMIEKQKFLALSAPRAEQLEDKDV
jgi:hypothetical protein